MPGFIEGWLNTVPAQRRDEVLEAAKRCSCMTNRQAWAELRRLLGSDGRLSTDVVMAGFRIAQHLNRQQHTFLRSKQ